MGLLELNRYPYEFTVNAMLDASLGKIQYRL